MSNNHQPTSLDGQFGFDDGSSGGNGGGAGSVNNNNTQFDPHAAAAFYGHYNNYHEVPPITNENGVQQQQQQQQQQQHYASLADIVLFEVENSPGHEDTRIELSEAGRERLRACLAKYEAANTRRLEEHQVTIGQLKQSVLDLTDKRMRQMGGHEQHVEHTQQLEYMLNEKEMRVAALMRALGERDEETQSLRRTIKDQDDIILTLNNANFEMKSSHEQVVRAKQESFRLLQEEMARKQRAVDEQAASVAEWRAKCERLQEEQRRTRDDFERRLDDKEIALRTKIATFEANLREGRHYFEEMLAAKDTSIRSLTAQLNKLQQQQQTNGSDENDDDQEEVNKEEEEVANPPVSATTTTTTGQSASDAAAMQSMRSLYEHQLDLLKVRIEMLERTCADYQQGIKDMNKSFGYQQQSDGMASMHAFKVYITNSKNTTIL